MTRYSTKPLVKLKYNRDTRPRMVSQHRLYPSNISLLDLPAFHYLINNDICTDDIFMAIIIHTAPQHFLHRNTIRRTWGRIHVKNKRVRTVFLLAEVSNETLQTALEMENVANRDMVQGSFLDSYKNLTYKHVMGLQWVSTYCSKAEFVLKMDDDIYVNIFRLVELLDERFPRVKNTKTRLGGNLACYHQRSMPVVRDPLSKWFVTQDEFSKDTFDDYCSGWAYFVSPKTARSLSEKASQLPYFWVDDVHITGTVANLVGIGRIRINEWFDIETQGLFEWSRSAQDVNWKMIFAPTWGDMELMKIAHQKAYRCYLIQCPCCYAPPTPEPKKERSASVTVRGVAMLVPLN